MMDRDSRIKKEKRRTGRGHWRSLFLPLLLAALLALGACSGGQDAKEPQAQQTQEESRAQTEAEIQTEQPPQETQEETETVQAQAGKSSLQLRKEAAAKVPAFSGSSSVPVNGNVPFFTDADKKKGQQDFLEHAGMDALGRCGTAWASLTQADMPQGERGSIGDIKPSGWHTVKYNGIDGNYLYNRCHLIGWQLAGENDEPRNLITGTRYMNVEGMEPYENLTAEYLSGNPGAHVLYRVTPIFSGNNLLADGVLMEALSVEDDGAGLCFCVWCYNVQPDIKIDYADGSSSGPEFTGTKMVSRSAGGAAVSGGARQAPARPDQGTDYVVNTNTKKFHLPGCSSVDDIKPKNRKDYKGDRQTLIDQGYKPCKRCNP